MSNRIWQTLLVGSCAIALSACGGGSSSSGGSAPRATVTPTPVAPVTPASTTPTWTQGEFLNSNQFGNRCETVRSGRDINGNDYPDVVGSLAQERFFLRSYSDETYLWYDEITDRNPNDFTDPVDYFDELRTTGLTVNNTPKDQFHFTIDSDEYEQIRSSGSTAGFGAQFTIIRGAPPRDIRIAFTEPGGPADQAGLVRGTQILTVDNKRVSDTDDIALLNAAFFPSDAGRTFSLGVQQPDGTTQTVTLTTQVVAESPVNLVKTVDIDDRKYGYLHFTTFSPFTSEEQLFDAFDTLAQAGIDDLVLDLRYNGGGLLDVSAQMAYMIAGPDQTAGKSFSTLQTNERTPGVNPVTGQTITPTGFLSRGEGFTVPSTRNASSVDLPRVFILSTEGTCSASEAVINGLRGIDVEVVLIGGKTCGKPYGFYPTDNCGTTYFTIQFRTVNDKNFGDYADGFAPNAVVGSIGDTVPGCTVADDFSKQLGDPNEAMFSAAVNYAATGSCSGTTTAEKPALTPRIGQSVRSDYDPAMDIRNDPRVRAMDVARNGLVAGEVRK